VRSGGGAELGRLGPSIYGDKRDVVGEVVALVDVTFKRRGLELIEARSRALPRGEIHELMITDEEAELGGRVDHVMVLGFFEVEVGGIVLVGDRVYLDGEPLGEVAGFDLTHMPNHMNIVVKVCHMERPKVGLGSRVIFRKEESTPSQTNLP